MAGLTYNDLIANSLVAEDVSDLVATLVPKEAPIVDFLTAGRGYVQAQQVKHEYVQDHMLPNYLTASTAIASTAANTAFQVNGLGNAVTVGTLLENESAAPELMQVVSIVGANSIVVTRNYDAVGVGSLAAGGQLYVRGYAGVEGANHSGAHTRRLGDRTANTVGYFAIELAATGTNLQLKQYGRDSLADAERKALVNLAHDLEKEIVRGALNSANSLASNTTTRTMKGIKGHISTINSTVTNTSFAANPHLYIGDVWKQIFANGGASTETWAIIAGATFYRNISDLNDTKVYDSNQTELFKRVVRRYTGPFGMAEVFLSRVLKDTELLLIPQERVRPVVFRPWQRIGIAPQGDNVKSMFVGEYSVEIHHERAMARITT